MIREVRQQDLLWHHRSLEKGQIVVARCHCQLECARNISGEFLSSVYAQLKFILCAMECLSPGNSVVAWPDSCATAA